MSILVFDNCTGLCISSALRLPTRASDKQEVRHLFSTRNCESISSLMPRNKSETSVKWL